MTEMPHMHRNADGTLVPWDGEHDGQRDIVPPGSNMGLLPAEFLDDFTALQVGMWQILDSLLFTTVDRRALMEGKVEQNTMRFERVFLDWPDTEDDQIPVPSATILAPAEHRLELEGPLSGRQIMEDTVNVFREGTVLRLLGELEAELQVVMWLAHKDDRAGVRKGMIEAFAAEPDDERPGRRVIVPQYFDRLARFDLRGISYDDNPEFARAKQWTLTARFTCDIQIVKLVQAPPTMLAPRINVTT